MNSSGGGNWVVAIDAGGTSTNAMLCSRSGEELATTVGESFNLRNKRVEALRHTVVNIVNNLFGDAQVMGRIPSMISIGAAGAGREQERKFIKDTIKARYPQSAVLVHHDAFIAHYGAFGGGEGVVVTSGTGSIAFGKNSIGGEARSGGWGWMLGDEGSGWWIGRESIRAALAHWEGSGPKTEITGLLKERFKVSSIYKVIPEIYSSDFRREDIADLSEHINKLARDGDQVAKKIMSKAGMEMGRMAVSTARTLKIPPEKLYVALLGSVGTKGGTLIENGVKECLKNYNLEDESVGLENIPDQLEENPDQLSLNGIESKNVEEGEGEDLPIPEQSYNPTFGRTIREFPPKDLRVDIGKGPGLIKPMESALWGAARWGIDTLNRKAFL